ncbi:hypothetical protein LPJ61_000974 [Coemansia biformis]|uniref:Uncharacterized protein n=1 Tax=Coemansia biformis TaxID=1286918 RepID=A0A9W7YFR3_9FUNG|nr:hypothetical protein LPJ61_000974 [Coemansia biformis]
MSFANLTSLVYDTISDTDLDPSEAEQQENFWARAMKRPKSGISSPYSPSRRKSLAEMSSQISPKDLDEWMQWQDDGGNVPAKSHALDETADMFAQAGRLPDGLHQEPITPPVSKERANRRPASPTGSMDDPVERGKAGQMPGTPHGGSDDGLEICGPAARDRATSGPAGGCADAADATTP